MIGLSIFIIRGSIRKDKNVRLIIIFNEDALTLYIHEADTTFEKSHIYTPKKSRGICIIMIMARNHDRVSNLYKNNSENAFDCCSMIPTPLLFLLLLLLLHHILCSPVGIAD